MIHQALFKNLKKIIPEMGEIPLFGNAPSFDLNKFSKLLGDRLELNELTLTCKEKVWKTKEELESGLGSDPFLITIDLKPLYIGIQLAISSTDVNKILSWTNESGSKGFSTEALKEGLLRYLLLQMIDVSSKIEPLNHFSFTLEESAKIPETLSYCIDIELQFEKNTAWVRLILSEEFRAKWVSHFSTFPLEYAPSPITKELELNTWLKIGSLSMNKEEWEEVMLGDFLPLFKTSYDPKSENGLALIEVEGLAIFHAKISKNQIELIEKNEEIMEEETQPEKIGDIPLTITVELAKLKMPLERLIHLQPGNTLEVPIDPSQSVSLTVNGKQIAKGDLIQLGEQWGIQVTSLG